MLNLYYFILAKRIADRRLMLRYLKVSNALAYYTMQIPIKDLHHWAACALTFQQ